MAEKKDKIQSILASIQEDDRDESETIYQKKGTKPVQFQEYKDDE